MSDKVKPERKPYVDPMTELACPCGSTVHKPGACRMLVVYDTVAKRLKLVWREGAFASCYCAHRGRFD